MHWAKQLMKTSKHLGSESKIASDYYHDLGVKNISRVVGTSKFIDEKKEKKYIEKLRKHYKAVGSSNIVFKTDVKKQKKTFFTEDDFNEDGSIKMSSILSPKKNMGVNMILPGLAAYAIGKGGQHVAKKLSNAKVKKITKEISDVAAFGGAGIGGLGAIMGATNPLYDYTPTTKNKARKMLRMKDEDLLRLLRGESISQEKIVIENHALK